MSDLGKALELIKQLERRRETNRIDYYQPYEWQKKFHNAIGFQTEKPAVEKAAICANQIGKCVGIRTKIEHPDGTFSTIGELYERDTPFKVLSWDGEKVVPADATRIVRKPPETIYRIYLESGDWFDCASSHRVLTKGDWRFVGHFLASAPSLPVCVAEFVRSTLGANGLRWFGKPLSFLADCLEGFRSCGGQPRLAASTGQVSLRLQADALGRTSIWSHEDGQDGRYTSTYRRAFYRLASWYDRSLSGGPFSAFSARDRVSISQAFRESIREVRRLSNAAFAELRSAFVSVRDQDESSLALFSPVKGTNRIVAYSVIGTEGVFDVSVPQYGNYVTCGVVHHNTFCAAAEVAFHVTGIYPDWFKGQRFMFPNDWIVAGVTNEVTRDICQNELLGDPKDDKKLGTGTIPRHLIGKTTRKAGVPNAIETVQVKHVSGRWSSVNFKCYEQGPKKFMGLRANGAWCDEEPPPEILSQVRRSVFARNPSVILMTFTPEEGATQVVTQLLDQPQKGQAVVRATWDDAPHFTAETKAQKLATIPEHERDMRTKGVPFAGAGMIFPFPEERLSVEPFDIPRHWPQIIGIDFGLDHPFAAALLCWDRDTDTVYVMAEYKERRAIPAVHAAAIKGWKGADWIPVAWPHDGLNEEKSTGDELRNAYVKVGLQMLPQKATNPPQAGQEEGQGGNSLEFSVMAMYERMELGKFKVFKTCREWFSEQRMYHRDTNRKIVKINDDLISASRYAHMMLRHARTETVRQPKRAVAVGLSNW